MPSIDSFLNPLHHCPAAAAARFSFSLRLQGMLFSDKIHSNLRKEGRTILTILCGIGGLAASILILAGGRSLIHGGTFADGLREFWNWAIAAMAGVSCGYSYWYNETKKKDKDDKEKQ